MAESVKYMLFKPVDLFDPQHLHISKHQTDMVAYFNHSTVEAEEGRSLGLVGHMV